MLHLTVDNTTLDVDGSEQLTIEEMNPIFNDRGTQSLPATIPATARNRLVLGFPDDPMSNADPNNPPKKVRVTCGAYQRDGILNVDTASRSEGISINVGFDNATLYQRWIKKKLYSLENLPEVNLGYDRMGWVRDWAGIWQPEPKFELALFPIVVSRTDDVVDPSSNGVQWLHDEEGDPVFAHYEILNDPRYIWMDNMGTPYTKKGIVDGKEVDITVPYGYGFTPFLKVWRVIELVFKDAGLEIVDGNPFFDDMTMSSLVVLNNVADGVATGVVRFSELLPECTVGEFLDALWARFGLVYNADFNAGTVRLKLIRDILRAPATLEVDEFVAGNYTVTYNTPQYVKMTANTSIDGAAPALERIEDFVPNGQSVSDLEIYDQQWGVNTEICITRRITGNSEKSVITTPFMNWDPQPEGMEPFELSGVDECVALRNVEMYRNKECIFRDCLPCYMVGAQHLHSKIRGVENDSDVGRGPLAFVFAGSYGESGPLGIYYRVIPEYVAWDYRGCVTAHLGESDAILADGSRPTFGLPYQGLDGLYATFWREFDESLRYNNRTVEVPTRMPMPLLRTVDLLATTRFRNVRCLFDSFSYSIPGKVPLAVDLKLRTMMPAAGNDEDLLVSNALQWRWTYADAPDE